MVKSSICLKFRLLVFSLSSLSSLIRKYDECVCYSLSSLQSTKLSMYKDGLQSLNQWEISFDFPRGSRVSGTSLFFMLYNVNDAPVQLALLAIIQRVGGIAVLPILPYLADGMGRRFTIFVGACTMIIGAIIQTSSQTVGVFIAARYFDSRSKFSFFFSALYADRIYA